jgi:hypothetical protein
MALAPEEEYHNNKQFQQLSLLSDQELAKLQSSSPQSYADQKVSKVGRPKDDPSQDQLPFPSEK